MLNDCSDYFNKTNNNNNNKKAQMGVCVHVKEERRRKVFLQLNFRGHAFS